MEDLKKLIAFIFQRSGKEKMKEKDIYMSLSFELGWMTPGQGKKVVEKALELNLVRREGEEIIPNFDYREIEIPLGFKFDEEKLEEMEKDLLSKIISKIVRNTKIGEKKIREEIRNISENLEIYPEIAALVVAKRKGIDIKEFIEEAKNLFL